MRLAPFAVAALAAALAGVAAAAPPPPEGPAGGSRAAIDRLISDYTGLYAGPTLQEWRRLFHPALAVFDPRPDGGIRARGLEAFYAAQKEYFATGRRISERLENVRVEEGRRIARVSADFVFVDEGEERRGKLGLYLAEGEQGWKVVGILFSYDEP